MAKRLFFAPGYLLGSLGALFALVLILLIFGLALRDKPRI
jgi:hypothetical protein